MKPGGSEVVERDGVGAFGEDCLDLVGAIRLLLPDAWGGEQRRAWIVELRLNC
jgi:hypothetical protein